MRLKPNEVRIVNQIRGMRNGRITIDKASETEIFVTVKRAAIVKQAESQNNFGQVRRTLRD